VVKLKPILHDSKPLCVRQLFSLEVRTVEGHIPLPDVDLYWEEQQLLTKMSTKRQKEFMAGRTCARYALAELGIHNFPLLPDESRQPVWPETVCGSIAHTDEYCAVAVAHKTNIRSIGLDIEHFGRLTSESCAQICTSAELGWLDSLPYDCYLQWATLIFSAKECFYKCQYPLSKQWLDFQDINIDIDQNEQTFVVNLPIDRQNFFFSGLLLKGNYLFIHDHVYTGLTIKKDV